MKAIGAALQFGEAGAPYSGVRHVAFIAGLFVDRANLKPTHG